MDLGHVRSLLVRAISSPDATVILAEYGPDKFAGILIGFTTTSFFNASLMAMEPAFFVKPEYGHTRLGKDLIGAYEYWAKLKGCSTVTIGHLNNGPTSKSWQRRGYTLTEQFYTKELN
jgi:hypothetical protein